MILKPENVVKTVDSLGRVTLPKALRDRMYINSNNNELEIFTFEMDGRTYIALGSPETKKNKLLAVAEVFKEMGVELPEEFRKKLEAEQLA